MVNTAKIVFAASWAIWTALAWAFVAGIGATTRVGVVTASAAGVLFVVVMASVHVIAYQVYKHQGENGDRASGTLAPAYPMAMKWTLLQQVVVGVLAALMLDGGLTGHVAVISMAAYWVASSVVVARRPDTPTAGDIRWMKYGFLWLFLIVATLGPVYWHARGRL